MMDPDYPDIERISNGHCHSKVMATLCSGPIFTTYTENEANTIS